VDNFLQRDLLHGENYSQYFLRLFDKRYGKFEGVVHEIWQSPDPVYKVKLNINHTPHKDLTNFYKKINIYSEARSHELFQKGIKTTIFEIIFYPLGKFFYCYFLRLGFLDGTPGIIMALGMSFHSFLVRAKLWCLYNP
jgi:hypothetical protein